MPPAKSSQPSRPPKPKRPNPVSTAIAKWLDSLPPAPAGADSSSRDILLAAAPKRWVVYHPMVLFPAGSFGGPAWQEAVVDDALWFGILAEVAAATGDGRALTHLAVNEGIPALVAAGLSGGERTTTVSGKEGVVTGGSGGGGGEKEEEEENYVRRPEGLRMLYGDFGPAPTEATRVRPSEADFGRAFWVATTQNGICQTWAPRYTMFSRGNVKEKARLLGFHEGGAGNDDSRRRRIWRDCWAVDLYAGIGYFAFSYAKLGMRVLCWEINPWSVEALRRGAVMNGWGVRVVQGEELDVPTSDVVFGGEDERIVVFLEDNRRAAARIEELRIWRQDELRNPHSDRPEAPLDIVHVNCGLLPQSTATWKDALAAVGPAHGWLHLHENVGVADIDSRRDEISGIFAGWLVDEGRGRKATVAHVERVKTYAPGVWHCVFDVHVIPPESEN